MMQNTCSLGFNGPHTTYYQKQTHAIFLSQRHRVMSVIIPKLDV